MLLRSTFLLAFLLLVVPANAADKEAPTGVTIDKTAKTITIDCQVAPRKPVQGKLYPIEVVATFPKGQKAHETVITFTAKPSAVHKALEGLGLKAGTPVMGKGPAPKGTEVAIFLELPEGKKIPLEEAMLDQATGKAIPQQRWLFTGSAMTNPDPEKDDLVYGADLTGTLITLFPVTKETVIQSALDFDNSSTLKVETNTKVLPKEGTPIKLIIQVK